MPTYEEVKKKAQQIIKDLPQGFRSNVMIKCPDCGAAIPVSIVIPRIQIEVYMGIVDRSGKVRFPS